MWCCGQVGVDWRWRQAERGQEEDAGLQRHVWGANCCAYLRMLNTSHCLVVNILQPVQVAVPKCVTCLLQCIHCLQHT